MNIIRYVNAAYCKLDFTPDLLAEIATMYIFRPEGYKFNPKFKANIWDGYIRLVTEHNGRCPVGLVPAILNWMVTNEYPVQMSDEFRAFGDTINFDLESLNLPFPPRDYQLQAVDLALKKKRQTLLLATSAGKSLVIYMLARTYVANGMKTLIIVPNVSLVSQLEADFTEYSTKNGFDVASQCHFISAGIDKSSNKRIVISTWQSLQGLLKTKAGMDVMKTYDAVIGDEVHLFKATVLGSLMNAATNAFCRVGLSGTLDGVAASEQTIVSLFGNIRRIVSAKELMDSGYATKAIVKPVILKYSDQVAKLAKGLPYDSELDLIVKSKKRNKFLVRFAHGLNGNALFLFRFVDKHAEVVKAMIEEAYPEKKVFIVSANTSKDDREMIRGYVEKHTNITIISTYALFSTGVNIKNLDHVVFASPTASPIKVLQSIGRSLRKLEGKLIANIWDIVDDLRGDKKSQNHLYRHYSGRLAVYEKEQFEISPLNIDFV